jgi:hypothetical protein
MTRTQWPLAALAMAALAMAALIGASCSNAPAATATSSGNSTAVTPEAGTGTNGGNTSAANHEQAMKFAACMRDNGIREFPDPDASGAFTVEQVANGTSVDTNSAAFKKALSACKNLEPAGFTGQKRSPEQQQAALKFAQCIRDSGVKDFPDPGPNDPLIDTNLIPSAATKGGMSILHAAMKKCSGQARDAGVSGGQ